MTDHPMDQQQLMQQALQEIRSLRARLKAYEDVQHEPIAVIGIGCRMPGGADSPAAFWRLLMEGRDVITEVPPERWDLEAYYDPDPDAPGKMYARHGAFLPAIEHFDAEFFGISPREAHSLDPQQRLLLEVSWEALEHANQAPDTLFGSATGVFVGIGGLDYPMLHSTSRPLSQIDAYFATGSALCVAAGRLSYFLGLTGPSLAVDTACSSSLVVTHLAVRSLRQRECNLALAGGVNLMLLPDFSINFCRARMLSPDGRCKTFDAAANGYVRGEGCGMVVLKRLADARADGDNILAVIVGSAVNQDGASGGLTVPSGPSQAEVIRQALRDGKLQPQQVSYLEAHGTGTALGDPIEIGAIAQVFDKRQVPLLVGAVKTNIGHLESASGIAGLIKTVLALRHGVIPPNLHFCTPNPRVAWEQIPVRIPTQSQPWPAGEARIAGVSAFGFSGTNAHIVLQGYSDPVKPTVAPQDSDPSRMPYVLTLSAKSEPALRQLATRYAQHLQAEPSLSVADLCATASTGRAHFAHCLAVIGQDAADLGQRLTAWQAGEPDRAVCTGALAQPPRPVFLCTGQGSQYAGMGRALYDSEPVFRQTLERCQDMLREHLPVPLLAVLYPSPEEPAPERIHDTAYTQPALFALEYSLAELWKAWGVQPAAVLGHSVGEYVAACIAGVFSVEDGLRLTAARGRLMQALPRHGAMLAVLAEESRLNDLLAPYWQTVSIAAVNGPASVVVSGARHTLDRLQEDLQRQGIRTTPLTVSHAFHSPLMEPMLEDFRQVAAGVTYTVPNMYFVANVTGDFATAEVATPEYWVRHVRCPVRFADSIRTLHRAGYNLFVEVGPKPTLSGLGQQCLSAGAATWLPSLRPGQERQQWCHSLGELYARGAAIRWPAADRRRAVTLPTYPFQRQRYWLEAAGRTRQPHTPASGHPLLGRRLASALRDVQFESCLSAHAPGYLDHHRVFGQVVVPAAALLEMAYAAGLVVLKGVRPVVEHSVVQQALLLPDNAALTVQTILTAAGSDRYTWQILSQVPPEGDEETVWVLHATGTIRAEHSAPPAIAIDLQQLQQRFSGATVGAAYYQQCLPPGLDYGASFQAIEQVLHGTDEALARLRLPAGLTESAENRWDYALHPVLLDACLQTVLAALPRAAASATYLPVRVERLQIWGHLTAPLWCHARLHAPVHATAPTVEASLDLYNAVGEHVAALQGLVGQRTDPGAMLRTRQADLQQYLYEVVWQPQSATASGASLDNHRAGNWLVLADNDGLGQGLAAELRDQGLQAVVVSHHRQTAGRGAQYCIDPENPHDYRQILHDLAPVAALVHMWSLDTLDELPSPRVSLSSTLALVQALVTAAAPTPPRLWLVTRGAQAVGNALPDLQVHQAPLWGMGQAIAQEHPELQCVCIDLDPGEDAPVRHLGESLQEAGTETRLAWRNGVRYVARLQHCPTPAATVAAPRMQPLQLRTSKAGLLENLSLEPMTRRAPGPAEVEIEVHAAGLNFRDVLRALGMAQIPTGKGLVPLAGELPFGLECAGTIVTVGAQVRGFVPGDEVMAVLAVGSLGHFVTVQADFVVPKPLGLTFVQAATIPLAFLTAHYGLNHLARLQSGERVLIHAAAGGVGLAAVQLVQQAGGEILATASPDKWDFLKSLGIRHVMHSRTLDFTEEVTRITHGVGVDVVLNSLNGAFIPASLEACARGARFIEIGKIGIWEQPQIQAKRPDVTYLPFDLGEVAAAQPGLIPTLFGEVAQRVDGATLKPLRHTVFPLQDAVPAFRSMAQARHIGKIVLAVRDRDTQQSAAVAPPLFPAGTYVITGGLGALGLAVARWMVHQGACHLVLVGRRPATPEAQQMIESLQETGAQVTVYRADVAVRQEVRGLFADMACRMPAVKGVIHAAGVLDDGVLTQQTWERYAGVLAPKVDGAWHLHECTREMALEYFVLFSSATAILGNAGQSSYAAANAFVDALALYRRANGLPAHTVNWGPWAEGGMASTVRRLPAQGIRRLRPEDSLAILERVLRAGRVQTCVLDVNWPTYVGACGNPASRAFFANLVESMPPAHSTDTASQEPEIVTQLRRELPVVREKVLLAFLHNLAKGVLGYTAEGAIAVDRPLLELGFDSLMAVELRNKLGQALHATLPASLLFDYPTLEKIRDFLLTEVLVWAESAHTPDLVATADSTTAAAVLAEIEQLLGTTPHAAQP